LGGDLIQWQAIGKKRINGGFFDSRLTSFPAWRMFHL